MDVLLRRILRAAVRRGLAGDWTWALIAVCAYVLRRSLNERGGVVSSLRISPGEQVLISVRNWDDPVFESEDGGSRADKRRAKENAKREAKMEEKLNAKRDKQLSKAQGKRRGTGADAVGGGGSSADAVDDNS